MKIYVCTRVCTKSGRALDAALRLSLSRQLIRDKLKYYYGDKNKTTPPTSPLPPQQTREVFVCSAESAESKKKVLTIYPRPELALLLACE
jgi:hypothetical protein